MTLNYNTLESLIAKKYMSDLFDNIFLKYSPVLAWLLEHSRTLEGRKLIVPVEYADGGNTQMIDPYGTVAVTPIDPVTAAEYSPKMAIASVVIDEQEDVIKSRTPLAVKSMLDVKVKNVEKSMAGSLTRAFLKIPESDGSMEYASEFNSIPFLVNDHASYSVGGIAPTDFSGWLSKVFVGGDFTDDFTVVDMVNSSTDTYIKKLYQRLLAIVKFRKSSGDVLIVQPQSVWDLFEGVLDTQKQGSPMNEKKGVAGFDTLYYRNAKIVAEDAMILEQSSDVDGQIYCLNSEYLWMAFSPGAKMASKPFLPTQNSMTMVKKFYTMGNMVTSARNTLARISGVASERAYVNPGSANEIAPV